MPAVMDTRRMPPKKPINSKTYLGRVAVRLRSLREDKGLSVAELSDRLLAAGLQVKCSAIYGWEQGKSFPHIEVLPTLAKIYGLESPGDVLPKK